MHFSLLVVSDQRPTDETLAKMMAPFNEEVGGENSQWDWYQIGGRWTGALDGYNPDEDPANIEVCSICGGTGKRNDELGQRTRLENPAYTCNGCQGKGKWVSWPTKWALHDGDRLQVKALSQPPKPTFAFLKDGKWSGKNWSDSDHDVEWDNKFNALFATLTPDTWITIVDCHT
jgi:hypothetical protein